MIIVVKIGTQAILAKNGTVQLASLDALVEQLVELHEAGHQVALVSSGAVGAGRRAARLSLKREYGRSTGELQVLASLGQHELMHEYSRLFKDRGLLAAQLLLTKQDFCTRRHYQNIARLLKNIFANGGIIPVINENDSVAVEELVFTDNDELAGLIATQINADHLIMITSVAGVYDRHPSEPGASLIESIDPTTDSWPKVDEGMSDHGRGGMISKLSTAKKMSQCGVTTHIVGLGADQFLLRVINGEALGTTILPAVKRSHIQHWLELNAHEYSGSVSVDLSLGRILEEGQHLVDIYPKNIQRTQGSFEEKDLIEILSSEGKRLAVGMACYGAADLQAAMAAGSMREFIQGDHLYIY